MIHLKIAIYWLGNLSYFLKSELLYLVFKITYTIWIHSACIIYLSNAPQIKLSASAKELFPFCHLQFTLMLTHISPSTVSSASRQALCLSKSEYPSNPIPHAQITHHNSPSSLITNPSPTSTVPTSINYKRYRYSRIPIAHTNSTIQLSLKSLLRVLILPLQLASKLLESSLKVYVLMACLMTRRVSYMTYTHIDSILSQICTLRHF